MKKSARHVLTLVLLGSVAGCASRRPLTPAGVAPKGVYAFTGTVDGEVVRGTLGFASPVLLSSSHGQCVRHIEEMRRWGGPFRVTCPAFSLVVRVEDDGRLQKVGMVRLRKPGLREERTSCRTFNQTTNTCVVWNTVTVEYDRWVEGQVRVEPRGTGGRAWSRPIRE